MANSSDVTIRPAEPRDGAALGRLGAALMRQHFDFDSDRFLPPGDSPEAEYGNFLVAQLQQDDVVIFVAVRDESVVGYVYAAVEGRSWKELRDRAGFIHDILIDENERGAGIGPRLIEAAAEWLVARGVPRVMLWTAQRNVAAQRLFERLGFRRTMIEMTRESKPRQT